jgi:hypothetical protein
MREHDSKLVLLAALFVLGLVSTIACSGQGTATATQTDEAAVEEASGEQFPEGTSTESGTDDAAAEASLEQRAAELAAREQEVARREEELTKPRDVVVTVPSGTSIAVEFLVALSSETNHEGDLFAARVYEDVVQDGMVVVPAGTGIEGRVTEAQDSKRIGGRAKLVLEFQRAKLASGADVPLYASFADAAKSQTKKDAATIGGATAGGAILGRVVGGDDKDKATVIGAVVGAAVGTAVAAETKGQTVVIEAGTVIDLVLDRDVQVTVKK